MATAGEGRIDRAVVESLYERHGDELFRFLLGVLRDSQLASDAFQSAFAKAIERGHTARPESRKAWLFRVAYNEAMLIRRQGAAAGRLAENVAWTRDTASTAADEPALQAETIERVQQAIDRLPPKQQQIVRMRIYEEKKFVDIAAELGIPLGTALGRMRTAMSELRKQLDDQS